MVRTGLFASLVLAPITIALHYLAHPPETLEFLLAALSLVPLAWLIGEATEHAAEHTGPGIGGFLNATFGNAPELIIAIVAVADGLTEIVRASLVGSISRVSRRPPRRRAPTRPGHPLGQWCRARETAVPSRRRDP